MLTSVAEASRKKYTSNATLHEVTDPTNKHIYNHVASTTNQGNINNDVEPTMVANNGTHIDGQRQHGRLICIGAWPHGTSTGLSAANIEMMEPRAIVRTGSSISREEREIDTFQQKHRASTFVSVPDSQEVQRLEWFRLLVVLLVLLICEISLFLLIYEGILNLAIVLLWENLIKAFLTIGFYTTGYIVFFIVLTEYHSAIGAFLDRYLYFRRRYQPLSLRVLAYLYAGGVLTRLVFLLLGVGLPMFWFL